MSNRPWLLGLCLTLLLAACATAAPEGEPASPPETPPAEAIAPVQPATPLPGAATRPAALHSPFRSESLDSLRYRVTLVQEDGSRAEVLETQYARDPVTLFARAKPAAEAEPVLVAAYADGHMYQHAFERVWWGMPVPGEVIQLQGEEPPLMGRIDEFRDQLEVIGRESINGYPTVHLRAGLATVQAMFEEEAQEFDPPQLDVGQIDLWAREADGLIVRWHFDIGGDGYNPYYIAGEYGRNQAIYDFSHLDEPLHGAAPAEALLFPEGSAPSERTSPTGERALSVDLPLDVAEATALVVEGMRAQGFWQAQGSGDDTEYLFRHDDQLGDIAVSIAPAEGTEGQSTLLFRFAPPPLDEHADEHADDTDDH